LEFPFDASNLFSRNNKQETTNACIEQPVLSAAAASQSDKQQNLKIC